MSAPGRVVLGVDPSLRSTGLGVIEARGTALRFVYGEVVRNPPARSHSASLLHLWETLSAVLAARPYDAAAIEGAFHFRNSRTALVLGQARGVVLAACARAGVPVYEYAPRRVKQAVTGGGGADKSQIARMMVRLLGLAQAPQEDVSDALAVAVCHVQAGVSRMLEDRKPL